MSARNVSHPALPEHAIAHQGRADDDDQQQQPAPTEHRHVPPRIGMRMWNNVDRTVSLHPIAGLSISRVPLRRPPRAP